MEASIRRANREDGPALSALDAVVWSPDVSPAPPAPPGREFFRESGPDSTLVAILDGAIAGYVKLAPVLDLDSNRHVLEVRGLAVNPSIHRRGLGRRLMEAAIAEAGRRGARRLTLRVLAANRPARTLYEQCGFEIEGVLRGEFLLDGRYVDDLLMALELTAAEGPRGGARS